MSRAQPRYQRVIVKVSGEGFCPPGGFGIHRAPLDRTAGEIKAVCELDAQVAVVVGGGNMLRGARFREELDIPAAAADYMGMLGTVMNALALQEALVRLGQPTRVQSAIRIDRACEPFDRLRCLRHLDKKRVVVLAGGTGNPHVTTDTCAALRAAELNAQLVLKATKVDGVYDDDPETNPRATLYEHMSYDQVIDGRLKVMDLSAIDICQQHNLPVIVFNLFKPHTMQRIVAGESLGTLIDAG